MSDSLEVRIPKVTRIIVTLTKKDSIVWNRKHKFNYMFNTQIYIERCIERESRDGY